MTRIAAAMRVVDDRVDQIEDLAAERLGVNRSDLRCLDALTRERGMTAGRLAAEVGLTSGATTTLLDRLEQRGYVVRRADPADRRRVLVDATESAAKAVSPVFAALVQAARAAMREFTAEELRTILRFAERSRSEIDAAVKRLRVERNA